jgi:aminoglycoside phosphotransferase (APT) family kinase protein
VDLAGASGLDLDRLREWFAARMPEARDVAIEACDRVMFGHSAETLLLTLAWRGLDGEHHREVVLRLRPPPPGLLEPYDLQRQFTILRAIEPTPVPAPHVFWHERTGAVLGREFYVMERLDGTVYEGRLPADLAGAPERIERMSRSLVETLAAIHRVDVAAVGLSSMAGHDHVNRDLAHWTSEMQRVRRDDLPALDRLAGELVEQHPEPCPAVTLVHGDPKPGNFAFVGDAVTAVFDWELATVGDPLTDVAYLECMWTTPGSFTNVPGAMTTDNAVALYEELTGIAVRHRDWYRALQGFKLAVIMLVGSMLFDSGISDDARLAYMGLGVSMFTEAALAELGVDERLETGPVTARPERMEILPR